MSNPNRYFQPEYDGIDHINVHSNGATELGRKLNNLAHTPFTHSQWGRFNSVEGFYWWVVTDGTFPQLKYLHGHTLRREIRLLGLPLLKVDKDSVSYLKDAIRLKITQNYQLGSKLVDCYLPLTCYTVYGKTKQGRKIVPCKERSEQIEYLEELRRELRPRTPKRMVI